MKIFAACRRNRRWNLTGDWAAPVYSSARSLSTATNAGKAGQCQTPPDTSDSRKAVPVPDDLAELR